MARSLLVAAALAAAWLSWSQTAISEEPERVSTGAALYPLDAVRAKNPDLAKGLPSRGILIKDLSSRGGFAKAGLREFDVITRIGERGMASEEDFLAWQAEAKPGQSYEVGYLRLADGENWRPGRLTLTTFAARKPLAVLGHLEVRLVDYGLGPVKLNRLGDKTESKEPLLWLRLAIENKSETKKADYRTWRGRLITVEKDFAIARDSFDNRLKRIDFGIGTKITGACDDEESIYPGKTVQDMLVFEAPVKRAASVRFALPRGNLGEEGESIEVELAVEDLTPPPVPPPAAEPAGSIPPPVRISGRDRVWHDREGKKLFTAEFQDFANGKARFVTEDNKLVEAKSADLSTADQEWIRAELKRRKPPPKGKK